MNGTRQLHGMLLCIALLMTGCSPSGPKEQAQTAAPPVRPDAAETQAAAPTPAAEAPVAETPAAAEAPVATPVPAQDAATASPAPVAATATTVTTQAPAATTVPPAAAPAPAPKAPPTASLAVATTPAATPSATAPAPSAATSPPPAAMSAIADPGGAVAVAATKPGLERVGAEACGDCHDVQFESWAGGAHAGRIPPVDCEDCHGPGSEYKAKAVMKDPAKARAAGLVMPDKAFCAKCHKKGVDDAFLARAHAHEE